MNEWGWQKQHQFSGHQAEVLWLDDNTDKKKGIILSHYYSLGYIEYSTARKIFHCRKRKKNTLPLLSCIRKSKEHSLHPFIFVSIVIFLFLQWQWQYWKVRNIIVLKSKEGFQRKQTWNVKSISKGILFPISDFYSISHSCLQ